MALLNLLGFPLKLKHHLVINTLNLLLVSLAILPARCVAACAAEPMQHFYHRLTAMMRVLTDEVLRTFGVVLSSAGAKGKEQRLLGREQCLAPCLALNAWSAVVLVSSQASRRCLRSGLEARFPAMCAPPDPPRRLLCRGSWCQQPPLRCWSSAPGCASCSAARLGRRLSNWMPRLCGRSWRPAFGCSCCWRACFGAVSSAGWGWRAERAVIFLQIDAPGAADHFQRIWRWLLSSPVLDQLSPPCDLVNSVAASLPHG